MDGDIWKRSFIGGFIVHSSDVEEMSQELDMQRHTRLDPH